MILARSFWDGVLTVDGVPDVALLQKFSAHEIGVWLQCWCDGRNLSGKLLPALSSRHESFPRSSSMFNVRQNRQYQTRMLLIDCIQSNSVWQTFWRIPLTKSEVYLMLSSTSTNIATWGRLENFISSAWPSRFSHLRIAVTLTCSWTAHKTNNSS